MTLSETNKIIAVLKATCPAWKPEPGTDEVWHSLLEDLDFGLVNAAVKRLLLTRKSPWPPSIGEIRAEAAALVTPEIAVSPEEAWGEVLGAIRRVGSYRAPAWSHEALAHTVETLGWRELCLSEEGDTGTRAHFFRVYQAQQVRARETATLPPALRLALPEPPRQRVERAPNVALLEEFPLKDRAANVARLRGLLAGVGR